MSGRSPVSAPIDAAGSIARSVGDDPRAVLRTVAQRYVGDAPQRPFRYRVTPEAGTLIDRDGSTRIDFERRFPEAEGQIAYAWGCVPDGCDDLRPFELEPAGPVRLFVDGDLVAEADTRHQAGREGPLTVDLPVSEGRNDIVIECKRTPAGFGCTMDPQFFWTPLRVLAPSVEREGQAGWIYTAPLEEPLETLPGPDPGSPAAPSETDTGVDWHPADPTPATETFEPVVEPSADGRTRAIAWTAVERATSGQLRFAVDHDERLELFLDGARCYDEAAGSRTVTLEVGTGRSAVVVGYDPRDTPAVDMDPADPEATLKQPHPIAGSETPWLHAGPVDTVDPAQATLPGLMEAGASPESASSRGTYWRTAPTAWVRPYAEREPFGTWTYPVGVTLYGVLETGRSLDRSDLVAYVREHLRACTSAFPFLEWDRERFGLPAVDVELAGCSALDYCGSMGATLLEAANGSDAGAGGASLPGVDAVADRIAAYMTEEQERLSDGTFCRFSDYDENVNETLWADDLYMSTPFLARHAARTGDGSYLDDAIHQFERFEHYLGLDDPTVFSHVYDGRHGAATGVPWGRGNGWALFAMAETLDRTPEEHPEREALLDRFQRFAAGYRSLQAADGFWHQVLTDPGAYKETSCTAMFTWAFARGVRRGWLPADPYARAAFDGWDALTRGAIDADGNVHGVCHGSSYAFHPDYYTEDLGTVTNDRHGIGIVLLAGVEAMRLRDDAT